MYSDHWGGDYSDRSRMTGGSRGYSNNYSNTGYPNDTVQMRQQLQEMMSRLDSMDRR